MRKNEKLKINFRTKEISGLVKGITFKEGEFYIHYIPSLNLSSYGKTKEEAHDMMKVAVLKDFCENAVTKPISVVMKELIRLGWNRSMIFSNELSKSTYIDKGGILRQFELDPNTEFEEEQVELC